MNRLLILLVLVSLWSGCAPDAANFDVNQSERALAFPTEVVSFQPGVNAGFGEESFPENVLDPAGPGGTRQPSLDVLSLGTGGVIVLGLAPRVLVDGPGVDFAVHENPFWPGGNAENVFAEWGEVSVSEDGEDWFTYPCLPETPDPDGVQQCAGWRPLKEAPAATGSPSGVGGDLFDLEGTGMDAVQWIRIRDMSKGGPSPSAGFDLDGITLFSWENQAN